MTTRFERDTAVTRRDDAVFLATVDAAWSVVRGPNGGYLAAIVLRALTERVGDPRRSPRSLTVHFAAPAEVGTITIVTHVERVGPSLTSCTARVTQEDRLVALVIAAFSSPRPGPEFSDLVPPTGPHPEQL